MPQPARRRSPLPVRIATWRRRVLVGSIGVFVAAWLAVAGLGRQATTQAQAQTSGSPAQSSDSQTNSSQSDLSSSDPSQSTSSQDLSSATTSQS